MIDGVIITPLKQILDERGKVMHMLRADSPVFTEFGEIYFSCIYPGAIKAWHFHKRMIQNYTVPQGRIKLVLFDGRSTSSTQGEIQELFLGLDNYCLVTVPPGVWNGFKGLGVETAIMCNCASILYDPDEIERKSVLDCDIPYDWQIKHQ